MERNKHLQYAGLSFLTALLFTAAWQPFYLFPLAFAGFVPLFMLERKIRQQEQNSFAWLFVYAWLGFLLWNIGSVWWIWNASPGGAIAAFIINSLPMVLPIMLFHARNRMNGNINYSYFIALWLSIEFLQFHWDFAYPWLLLGNVFSYVPILAQWYEFTGILGGSLWVLLVNMEVDKLVQQWNLWPAPIRRQKVLNKVFLFLISPAFLSIYIWNNLPTQSLKKAEMVVVQPNFDPYSDKFGGLSDTEQLAEILRLAEPKIDGKVQYLLFPETALQGNLLENYLMNEPLIIQLQEFLKKHPHVVIVSGMDSYYQYAENERRSLAARKFRNGEGYYEVYNSALQINSYDSVQVYHKSKLVPGVEKMPYPQLFKFLEDYAIDLGGTSGSLGQDSESKNFKSYHKISVAPIICYESVFPEFVASYVKKGADVLCILTNDGWWGNTPGYKQHFDFGRLRAIENRRAIARAANTGISGFIDRDGSIIKASNYWEKDVLRSSVPIYLEETFYSKYGDWLSYIFLFIAISDSFTLFLRRR
ncbi:MAG: apolipoprotein N-acyltransferase [Bacteroidia bacterium]|nr:apolipoprotein N-acyltransferase [Bacteroidia bacterium]